MGTPDPVLGPATVAGRQDGHNWYNLLGSMDELRLSSGIRYGGDISSLGGSITLEGFIGSLDLLPVSIDLKQQGVTVASQSVTLAQNPGGYAFLNLDPGVYDVEVSASGFLRRVFPGVVVWAGQSVTLDTLLLNGDTDGDNEVTSTDMSVPLKNAGQSGD